MENRNYVIASINRTEKPYVVYYVDDVNGTYEYGSILEAKRFTEQEVVEFIKDRIGDQLYLGFSVINISDVTFGCIWGTASYVTTSTESP